MRSRQRGYSLAEILVVVAIVGVLSMAAIPTFLNFTRANQMRTASRQFITDYRSLRQLCVTRMLRGKISFRTGVGQYTYTLFTSPPTGAPNWTQVKLPREFDKAVYFESASVFDDYDSDGTIDICLIPSGSLQKPPPPPAASGDQPYVTTQQNQTINVVLRTTWDKIMYDRYTLTFSTAGSVNTARTHS